MTFKSKWGITTTTMLLEIDRIYEIDKELGTAVGNAWNNAIGIIEESGVDTLEILNRAQKNITKKYTEEDFNSEEDLEDQMSKELELEEFIKTQNVVQISILSKRFDITPKVVTRVIFQMIEKDILEPVYKVEGNEWTEKLSSFINESPDKIIVGFRKK